MGVFLWGVIAGIWTVALAIGASVAWLRFLGARLGVRRGRRRSAGPSPLITYPTDYIFAVFDDALSADQAIGDLQGAGIGRADVIRLTGEGGAARLDASGEQHGLFGRIIRIAQATTMDQDHAARYELEARNGHYVVGVHVHGPDERRAVEAAAHQHGAHFVNWYGRFQFENIVT